MWLYGVSTAFLALVPTSLLVLGEHTYYWGSYPKAGVLHPLLLIYFAIAGGLSLRSLYSTYKAKHEIAPVEAIRAKFVFWAFLIGYVGSLDFVQSYGVEIYPVGFAFVSLWVILITYAIARYQVLDMPVIVTGANALRYAQGFAVIVAFYGLTLLLIEVFTGSREFALAGILLAATLICAEVVVGLQRRMERAIGRALFPERHDAYETLTAFSRDMVTILDLKQLCNRFLGTLAQVLNIPVVSLFTLDKEKQVYALASVRGPATDDISGYRIASSDPLAQHLLLHKSAIVQEELAYTNPKGKDDAVVSTMKLMQSEVCLPLINQDRLVGFCNLGPRARHQMYSAEDLSLLTTLAQNAAIALDNALLYEDLKRSQLLMRRTDRLRSLETIAGGFAHEIRNPLTSIKTFIQLAPERKDDPEFIVGFSKVVNEDVYRIERLIEEILDYARYMKPRLTSDNLNDIVASCLYFVQIKAESLGIIIEMDLAQELPLVMLDRQQVKQVLLNLLLNALDAMREQGGRLTITTHKLTKQGGDEWVQVEVSDTGPGIDATNLEHIFDPFYTTKHESVDHEGTGLGLAIVHQIVQEHRGTIEVDSMVGRGTTFLVNLPSSTKEAEGTPFSEEHEETGPVSR